MGCKSIYKLYSTMFDINNWLIYDEKAQNHRWALRLAGRYALLTR